MARSAVSSPRSLASLLWRGGVDRRGQELARRRPRGRVRRGRSVAPAAAARAARPHPRLAALGARARPSATSASRACCCASASLDVGWGKAQDLRAAVLRLREKGKRTVAYLELEKYGANVEYYVASAADAVYVAPATRTPLVGLAAEHLFLGGLFEKLGVKLEYERVGKYKSAVEGLAEREMSDANREMSEAILDSIQSQFLGDIAASRGMTREALAAAVDRAPTSPRGARAGEADRRRRFLRRDRRARRAARRSSRTRSTRASTPSEVGFSPEATFALDLRRRLRRGGRGPLRAQRRAGDGVGHAGRGLRAGRREPRGARDRVPHRQPRRLGARLGPDLARACARRAPRASRWSRPSPTSPPRAATTSPRAPTRSWRSRARSPARSACS